MGKGSHWMLASSKGKCKRKKDLLVAKHVVKNLESKLSQLNG